MTSYLKMATVREKAMCVLWFFETKSVTKMQRRYRTQHGKDPPADNVIRRWVKQFQETGSVLHRHGAGRPSISQELVDRIQQAFSRTPRNQLDELLCGYVYHKRLFGGMFITAFTSMSPGHRNPDNNLESSCTYRPEWPQFIHHIPSTHRTQEYTRYRESIICCTHRVQHFSM
jgi:hypothetical protein